MMRRFGLHAWGWLLAGSMVAAVPVPAASQVLYDAAAPGAHAPGDAGWLTGTFVGLTETVTGDGALVSVAPTPFGRNLAQGGYSNHYAGGSLVNPAFAQLDSVAGYRLDLGFRVDGEQHAVANRAGFSVILIGHDLRGVELAFRNDGIFAQTAGPNYFTVGESNVDPLAVGRALALNRWQIQVQGDSYSLTQGGSVILAGNLRDYSGYAGNGQTAYRTPDFLFVGDDTQSASSSFLLSYAAITTPVPEMPPWALMLCGLALVGAMARLRAR
jgi:hypothetical protein